MFSTFGLVHGHQQRLHFLGNLKSRLKKHGRLVLHVHNELRASKVISYFSRDYLDELALRARGTIEAGDHMQRNYRGILDLRLHYFTSSEIKLTLQEAGFAILDFFYLNETRTGSLQSDDRDERANGFLITAESL